VIRVALVHDYRDEQQPSMRLYAERLGAALTRRGAGVRHIRAPEAIPDPWRRRSPAMAKLDMYLGRYVIAPRLLRARSEDILHVVDHGEAHVLAGLHPQQPIIVTCHDVILLALESGRISGARVPRVALELFRISLQFVKRASMVVADSTQTKRDLVDLVGIEPARIQVVHPGLNQSFAPDPARGAALRARLGLDPKAPLVLQLGRMFYKNIPAVLRVLGCLRRDGVDARLVRVGRPLDGSDAALAHQLGIAGQIVELGALPDADLPGLYNAVDLLLFPSFYEGFGWPPLEAMASGTPVVCSRAGSLDEVIGDAALTADPEDTDALAWHAASALTDAKLRGRLIQRGLERAGAFSWDRAATQMIDLYRSVLDRAA
jgi:glycosyltransferase involved in cell wall biosynthesis